MAVSRNVIIPIFVDGVAAEEQEKKEGKVGDDNDDDEGPNPISQTTKLSESEKEKTDRELSQGQRSYCLVWKFRCQSLTV